MYTEDEWRTEWMNLLKLASTKPRIFSGSETSCCDSPTTKGFVTSFKACDMRPI